MSTALIPMSQPASSGCAQQDRQRIGLLAGRAAEREQLQLAHVGAGADAGRQHQLGERAKLIGVAEEEGLADRQLLGERGDLIVPVERRFEPRAIRLDARAAGRLQPPAEQRQQCVEPPLLVAKAEMSATSAENRSTSARRSPIQGATRGASTRPELVRTSRADRSATISSASSTPIDLIASASAARKTPAAASRADSDRARAAPGRRQPAARSAARRGAA